MKTIQVTEKPRLFRMKGLYHQNGSQFFWYRFRVGGKEYRFSTGETDEAKAIIEAKRLRANPPIAEARDLLSEVETFCAVRSGNYKRDSFSVLRAFARAMNGTSPREITASKIQDWLNSGKRQRKDETKEAYRFQIEKLFEWLIGQGKARTNPAKEISIEIETRSTRKNWIHKRQYPAIFEVCADLELKFALYCGFYGGLRKDEVIMFRPEWIDRDIGEYGVLNVTFAPDWRPKDGTERTIPLAPEFRDFLDNGFPRLPGPYMIAPYKHKEKCDRYRVDFRTKFENFVAKIKTLTGLEFTFHDTRRSFASNLVSAGVSVYKVAKWLGDDVDVVSRTYGHLSPDDADLAAAFGAKPKIVTFDSERIN
jgi:integrase